MTINSVNKPQNSYDAQKHQKEIGKTNEKKDEISSAPKAQDTFEKSKAYVVDADKVNSMKSELANNLSAFKKMVMVLLRNQGHEFNKAADIVEIDEAVQLQAQAAIADDGYWGVEQTADRILEFAKAISGGDPAKIELLRDAFIEGFKAAEAAWGGTLPDISSKTFERVMQGFKEWENSKQ